MSTGLTLRSRESAISWGTTRRIAVLWLAAVLAGAAGQGFTAELTEADLIRQLRAPPKTAAEADADAATSKSLGRVRMPDRNGACSGTEDGGASGKNLMVIPLAPVGAPQADLQLQFEYAAYTLTAGDRRQLDVLARALASPELRDGRFTVSGHTDASGDAAINQKLSCARALSARGHLMDRGVQSGRLSVYGFGSSRPVRQGAVDVAANRRVEIRRAEGS